MGILSWILIGLVAGALAKLLMPGKDGGGFIMTTVLGIVGAFVGGFIGSQFLGIGSVSGFDLTSVGIATGGSFLVLLIYKTLFGKKKGD